MQSALRRAGGRNRRLAPRTGRRRHRIRQAPPRPAAAKPDAVTTDVVVARNDTLDRIFRKLNLNLTDLANLRALPGIKTHLDNLRLGESLHFVYRDD